MSVTVSGEKNIAPSRTAGRFLELRLSPETQRAGNFNIPNDYNVSSVFDIIESRLRFGLKSTRRRCWWEEGRIRAAKARFTRSPSTPPILTREFVIADLRAFNLLGEYGAGGCEIIPLWRLQRNEPGWVVGEHIHVLFELLCLCTTRLLPPLREETDTDLFGEVARSRENRTDGTETEGEPWSFTRDGEVDLQKKEVADLEEKLEVDEDEFR